MPATASFAAGILTVNGTTGNDSIVLRHNNGKVSIDGISRQYNSANVTSIVVNAGKGSDNVNLAGLKPTWTKQITVNSASGTDKVKHLDGHITTLKGANQQLIINGDDGGPGGGGGGDGIGDWFDSNIQDAALRQLLRTEYADNGGLERNEMLGVFNQVENDGTVTSTEFSDLTDVANNASLFAFNYVTELTRSVVLGSVANAHFQGTNLGNLTAGSSAGKLDKLVDKWFLGADHPDASYDGLNVTYVTAAGTLFGASGPQYTDVRQGAVGDCYYVAALGEIALRNPSAIQNMFIVNGDGTYTVRFFQDGTARFVTVDSMLPTYSNGWFLYANMGDHSSDSSNVLWVALAEKAYAQMNEAGWLRPVAWGGGENSYIGIEGGMYNDTTEQVVNQVAINYWVNGSSDANAMANAWNSGKLIGFASKSSPADSRIVGGHQYIVVGYNSSTQTVTLFNPWGINNGSEYPGIVNMTLSQIEDSFDYWSIA